MKYEVVLTDGAVHAAGTREVLVYRLGSGMRTGWGEVRFRVRKSSGAMVC